MTATLHLADNMDILKTLADASVDAVVTDPPYGLKFMGKKWDSAVPCTPVWAECLRVLKPGGHLLAFAGTRTQHRMASAIEDAGFEIRDMIAWVYGSGFPKSLDVGKAIDREAGAERTEIVGRSAYEGKRPNSWGGNENGNNAYGDFAAQPEMLITAPATEAARQWNGWGTALKPALEPITLARKPFPGTVAANVQQHGTGAINVDGCRVELEPDFAKYKNPGTGKAGTHVYSGGWAGDSKPMGHPESARHNSGGRWPANLIHDGSEEVAALFPETKSGGYPPEGGQRSQVSTFGKPSIRGDRKFTCSEGSAARFFYCAKASKADRDEGCESMPLHETRYGKNMSSSDRGTISNSVTPSRNNHPTVKPTALMRYLCRLVTPPGGLVLDPFMGSGSTGKAAILEGFRFIGIDSDPESYAIAQCRVHSSIRVHPCPSVVKK
jgi:site-specific DNA-methyltransferase (adenine-specific)